MYLTCPYTCELALLAMQAAGGAGKVNVSCGPHAAACWMAFKIEANVDTAPVMHRRWGPISH